jgi:hypothetical protein
MINELIIAGHPFNDMTGKKLNYLENALPHFEFAHHKSHLYETEPRRPSRQADA